MKTIPQPIAALLFASGFVLETWATWTRTAILFITGRLKEIINRGGEKISPLEVDEVLMEHPAVAQVATFSVPHPALGENVAAAIVLKSDFSVPELFEYRRKQDRTSDPGDPRICCNASRSVQSAATDSDRG